MPSPSQLTTESFPAPTRFCSECPDGPISEMGKLRLGEVQGLAPGPTGLVVVVLGPGLSLGSPVSD